MCVCVVEGGGGITNWMNFWQTAGMGVLGEKANKSIWNLYNINSQALNVRHQLVIAFSPSSVHTFSVKGQNLCQSHSAQTAELKLSDKSHTHTQAYIKPRENMKGISKGCRQWAQYLYHFQTMGQGKRAGYRTQQESGRWDSMGVGFGSKAEFMLCDKKNPFQSTADQHHKLTWCGNADIPDDNNTNRFSD